MATRQLLNSAGLVSMRGQCRLHTWVVNEDPGGTQEPVLQHITVLCDIDDDSWLLPVVLHHHHGLVQLRVEEHVERFDLLDSEALDGGAEQPIGRPDPLYESSIGVASLGGRQRPLKIVSNHQKFASEIADCKLP